LSWINEIKQRHDIVSTFAMVGMTGKRMRYGPCPACGATRTSTDTRPPVRASGRHSWWCNSCQNKGDIFDLVSYVQWGHNSKEADFAQLKQYFMDKNAYTPSYQPEDLAKYPPTPQVSWIMEQALHLDNHLVEDDVWDYLHTRGINPISTSARRVNPELDYGTLKWVKSSSGKKMPWWPTKWCDLFPIVVPMYNHKGELTSLHGRSIQSNTNRKTTAPLGFSAKGLYFMNKRALQMCTGDLEPTEVWITEGEIDFLSLEQFTREEELTVIGIKSGSLTSDLLPIPTRAKIFICTDPDESGDKYAQKLIQLYPQNTLLRVRHG